MSQKTLIRQIDLAFKQKLYDNLPTNQTDKIIWSILFDLTDNEVEFIYNTKDFNSLSNWLNPTYI